jgi:uncharacterized membrane protein
MEFQQVMEALARGVDAMGVGVMLFGAVLVSGIYLRTVFGRGELHAAYRRLRRGLGSSILLGLEFLIVADIIRTVSVEPSFESLGVLAVLVAIRTGLSFALEVELSGRWPWKVEHSDRAPEV